MINYHVLVWSSWNKAWNLSSLPTTPEHRHGFQKFNQLGSSQCFNQSFQTSNDRRVFLLLLLFSSPLFPSPCEIFFSLFPSSASEIMIPLRRKLLPSMFSLILFKRTDWSSSLLFDSGNALFTCLSDWFLTTKWTTQSWQVATFIHRSEKRQQAWVSWLSSYSGHVKKKSDVRESPPVVFDYLELWSMRNM